MISLKQVEDQLKQVGCNFHFWGRPEIKELQNILIAGETIAQAVNGRYESGFAMLCITDQRLLLIDKKPMFLTLEDIRFDMISEIDYNQQLMDGTIRIMTPNRKLVFNSWSQDRLRKLLNYAQQRITDLRHHYIQKQFEAPQRNDRIAAIRVGGIILANALGAMRPKTAAFSIPLNPFNPYLGGGLTLRKRRVPKFY